MGVMRQNILPCFIWKNTKESENFTRIPKPHLSTSLTHMWGLIFAKFEVNCKSIETST